MENLARYIIRASFSQEYMQYLDQEGKVFYTAKDGRTRKSFPAQEWFAAMCSHIPNREEQMVRYYGHYSNVSRGKRQKVKKTADAIHPSHIDRQRTPYFVVKIPLTHKILLHILPPRKRKFLSITFT